MAEEESETPIILQPLWSNGPEAVPEVYVNRFIISEGASDVSIALGSEYREAGQPSQRLCRVRLMMTHDQFFQFAGEVRREVEFLRLLYRGNPSSLRGVSRDEYNDAVSEIYSEVWETSGEDDEKQF